MPKPVWIAGSSGLIGNALRSELRKRGMEVKRLVRKRLPESCADSSYWDPASGQIDTKALEGAAAIINLCGAGVGDKRWSSTRKQKLKSSRLDATKLLAVTVQSLKEPPECFMCASAIGIYGDRGDETLTESSPPGVGFMAELCAEWESAAAEASAVTRTVMLRTGLVLAAHGGFLRKQLPLFKAGLGGRLGSSNRWLSWISLHDEVAAICWLLEADLEGAVNLTAPESANNAEFVRTLGEVLKRPAVLRIPLAVPSLLLGREAVRSLTESARVLPKKLHDEGFEFELPILRTALEKELSIKSPQPSTTLSP